jgi:photosystem II stability/assembly factor-like uncharacterized protein
LAADGSLIVTVSDTNAAGPQKGKIYRSTDRGNTYTLVHTNSAVGEIVTAGPTRVPGTDTLIAVTGSSGTAGTFIRSTDNGATWAETDTTGGNSALFAVGSAANGNIVAGGRDGFPPSSPTVWISTDDGLNFSSAQVLSASDSAISAFCTLRNGDILCGKNYSRGEVWRSSDHGVSWSHMADVKDQSSLFTIIYAFVQLPSGIVLAGGGQKAPICASSDNGGSWWLVTELTAGGQYVYDFMLLNDGEALAATNINNTGDIYKSIDQGMSWSFLSSTGHTSTRTLCRTAL